LGTEFAPAFDLARFLIARTTPFERKARWGEFPEIGACAPGALRLEQKWNIRFGDPAVDKRLPRRAAGSALL